MYMCDYTRPITVKGYLFHLYLCMCEVHASCDKSWGSKKKLSTTLQCSPSVDLFPSWDGCDCPFLCLVSPCHSFISSVSHSLGCVPVWAHWMDPCQHSRLDLVVHLGMITDFLHQLAAVSMYGDSCTLLWSPLAVGVYSQCTYLYCDS